MEEENLLCYCGERFNDYQREQIRSQVCGRNAVRYADEHGNQYCVFHHPSFTKSDEFKKAFSQRLAAGKNNFYGAWFPCDPNLEGRGFDFLNFAWAEFRTDVSFKNVAFREGCDFQCAQFFGAATFTGSRFSRQLPDAEANFYSVSFNVEANFSNTKFAGPANFSEAKFWDVETPEGTYDRFLLSSFYDSTFESIAKFDKAEFGSARETSSSFSFGQCKFVQRALFANAKFLIPTSFADSKFSQMADFSQTLVSKSISFRGAEFESYGKFSGFESNHNSWRDEALDFVDVQIKSPERMTFLTLNLKPDSFMGTDVRKFDFTDVVWKVKNFAFDWSRFSDVFWWKPDARSRRSSYIRLEKVYRQFAAFAEDSSDHENAGRFRFAALDIRRITPWYGRLPLTLLWFYKWSSGYGESWRHALLVLLLILSSFGAFYSSSYAKFEQPTTSNTLQTAETSTQEMQMDILDGAVYSLNVAALQKPEPKPADILTRFMVIAQTILAPIQAALLAFAMRRRFVK